MSAHPPSEESLGDAARRVVRTRRALLWQTIPVITLPGLVMVGALGMFVGVLGLLSLVDWSTMELDDSPLRAALGVFVVVAGLGSIAGGIVLANHVRVHWMVRLVVAMSAAVCGSDASTRLRHPAVNERSSLARRRLMRRLHALVGAQSAAVAARAVTDNRHVERASYAVDGAISISAPFALPLLTCASLDESDDDDVRGMLRTMRAWMGSNGRTGAGLLFGSWLTQMAAGLVAFTLLAAGMALVLVTGWYRDAPWLIVVPAIPACVGMFAARAWSVTVQSVIAVAVFHAWRDRACPAAFAATALADPNALGPPIDEAELADELVRRRRRDLQMGVQQLLQELAKYTTAEEVDRVRSMLDAGTFRADHLDDLVHHRREAWMRRSA